ncbi:N-acetyltransferase family protein [Sphingomonas sp. MMS24-JH45]
MLYEALVDTLRAQGFTQAIGVILLPAYDASISLHEAVGFRRGGVFREVGFKQGRWIDVGWWQCELRGTARSRRSSRAASPMSACVATDGAIARLRRSPQVTGAGTWRTTISTSRCRKS